MFARQLPSMIAGITPTEVTYGSRSRNANKINFFIFKILPQKIKYETT